MDFVTTDAATIMINMSWQMLADDDIDSINELFNLSRSEWLQFLLFNFNVEQEKIYFLHKNDWNG